MDKTNVKEGEKKIKQTDTNIHYQTICKNKFVFGEEFYRCLIAQPTPSNKQRQEKEAHKKIKA